MSREFEHLIDTSDLDPAERERLFRAHELLLAAGPPPELTAGIRQPPAPVVRLRARRRAAGALAAAAAVAAACFAGGYELAAGGGGMKVARSATMEDRQGRALASLRIGYMQQGGNWPVEMTVRGLPQQRNRAAYYLLLLWKDGKPAGVCGAFRVDAGQTTVHFDVPYRITRGTHWVVTAMRPGERYPGTVVLTTA
jgi:hypothetical protein